MDTNFAGKAKLYRRLRRNRAWTRGNIGTCVRNKKTVDPFAYWVGRRERDEYSDHPRASCANLSECPLPASAISANPSPGP